MALMVREIVGVGTLAEVDGAAGAVVCAWAAAAAKRRTARDRIFKRVLDLGEMRAG
jgi:hypothetical protein